MKKIIFAMGLLLSVLISPLARGQDAAVFYRVESSTTTVVTALSCDGILTWSNAAVGVTGHIQRASTLDGVSNWTDFTAYRSTGTFVTLPTADYLVVDLADGPAATNYPVSYLVAVPAGGWSDEYKTIKLVFRRIAAGTFTMGSPGGELGRYSDEVQHQVTISQPFYMGVFEVTQKQWERVMGNYPSYFTNITHRDSRPVEGISYNTIRGTNNWPTSALVGTNTFMGRLRARTGLAFDLPTEAQWEYAGRAGTVTALNSGQNLTNTDADASMNAVGRYWYNGGLGYTQNGDSSLGTAKAGSYLPNTWGLYDIHGNVWEWCLDKYGTYPGTVTDPLGPTSGSSCVNRGGGWDYFAQGCRSAQRFEEPPAFAYEFLGFRAALPLGQ